MYRKVMSHPCLSRYKMWHALYVKSRQEKKVSAYYDQSGLPYYLPMHKVVRVWSDRKKWVEEPLIRGYIFIPVSQDKAKSLDTYIQVPGVVNLVKFNSNPATISRDELKALDHFLQLGYHITQTEAEEFKPGDAIRVVGGPFKGLVGRVITEQNRKLFLVSLLSFNKAFKVSVPAQTLLLIEQDSAPYA